MKTELQHVGLYSLTRMQSFGESFLFRTALGKEGGKKEGNKKNPPKYAFLMIATRQCKLKPVSKIQGGVGGWPLSTLSIVFTQM